MGFFADVLGNLAQRMGYEVQGEVPLQAYRDNLAKAEGFSVESEVSEALADLVVMLSAIPVSGSSERARWINAIMDSFVWNKLKPVVCASFLTGDCLVIPSWNGRTLENVVVDTDNFDILGCVGDELTAVSYVVDNMQRGGSRYSLVQVVELVPYRTADGSQAMANRYSMHVLRNGSVEVPLSDFPEWSSRYENEWEIPNVDRLLVARMRSHTVNPRDLNAVKGVPICFGASTYIDNIHYLLAQMRNEFGLSEKAIMADKRLFKREWRNGKLETDMPSGRERLFMEVDGMGGDMTIREWSPEIRYQAYLDALDKQERLVERAVGVSSGVISTPEDVSYQNVDNVRKSQQKTMAFVDASRNAAESCVTNLVYAWEVLANFYGINPVGEYELSFDWSNEYVETFADRQNAIIAGVGIGAMDAIDYRMFVTDESPDAARKRVEEIQAARSAAQEFVIEEA